VVDQDAAHQLSGNGKEVSAIAPGHMVGINQLDVNLIDKLRGLEEVPGLFPRHIALCQAVQLAVNEGH
jgi:hypothetical protein